MNLYKSIFLFLIVLLLPGCSNSIAAATENPNEFDFTFPSQNTQENSSSSHIRNIIIFIGDGMQLANEISLSRYLYGNDYGLSWHRFEYKGFATTWDIDTYNRHARRQGKPAFSYGLAGVGFDPIVGFDPSHGGNSPWPLCIAPDSGYLFTALPTWNGGSNTYAVPATDSASAATAIATGWKTDQGNISWKSGDPPNGQLTTICEKLAESCIKTGVVTSVEFSHATPSPFVAHNVSRGNPGQIANEIINVTKPDVVIGAGHPTWISGYISSSNYQALKNSSEYVFVERIAGINGGNALFEASQKAINQNRKLFGLFGGSNGCFEPPVPVDSPGFPKFTVNEENPSLAEATEAALNVLASGENGFFLMVEQGDLDWANHYNDYHWMIGAMWDLEEAVKSAVNYINKSGDNIDWSNTLIIVTSDHATGGLRIPDSNRLGMGDMPQMTGTKYKYSFPGGEVSYKTTAHINEPVMAWANGAGVDLFSTYEGIWYPGTKLIDNTHIYEIMMYFAINQ